MRHTITCGKSAFTFVEMFVVIVVIALLASMIIPNTHRAVSTGSRISCLNNFKEIGVAYRLWEEDNGGLRPSQQSRSNGGWKELLADPGPGAFCWTNYAIMASDLGQAPRLLICPSDERQPATDFITSNAPPAPGHSYFNDNNRLSYFVGVSANDDAATIMGGDRNLGAGTKSDADYGYSPKSGDGSDVAVPIAGPVSWSLKMHSPRYPGGAGNILLGDGSCQEVSTLGFNTLWLRHATPTTNWPAGHTPASPSIRIVFP